MNSGPEALVLVAIILIGLVVSVGLALYAGSIENSMRYTITIESTTHYCDAYTFHQGEGTPVLLLQGCLLQGCLTFGSRHDVKLLYPANVMIEERIK